MMRWVAIGAGVATVVVLIVLAGGWLAFQHIPSWYDPPQVVAADLPRVRSSLPREYQRFTDAVVHGGRFEYALSARTVNQWIAARGELWPDAREALPKWLADPMVVFEGGRIIVAGRYERDNLKSVVSVNVAVRARGDWIEIKMGRVALGSLGVPREVVIGSFEKRFAKLMATASRALQPTRRSAQTEARGSPDGMDARQVMDEGVRIENRFHWSNGKRDFRIIDVRVEDGEVVLTGETL